MGIISCSRQPHPKFHIGVSQPCHDEWREKMNNEIRREMLFHDDVEVEFRSADNDSRRQIEDIRHFIEAGVDLIIVAPNEAQTVTPILKEAFDRGIAVVTFDRNVYGDAYTSHFEPDNEEIGHLASLYARHIVPGMVNALEIRGLDYSTPAQQRHAGFVRDVDSVDNFSVISVGGTWSANSAVAITDSVLRIHPEINVIYAHNDGMAIAASKTARSMGRHDIRIIGTDAAPVPGLKAVDDSVIDATVIYPTEGGRVFRSAVDILHGRRVPKDDHLGNNSVVDRSNADILIRQNDLLKAETDKVEKLKAANVELDKSRRAKTKHVYILMASAFVLLLALVILFLYLRQIRRYHRMLADKNSQLEDEQRKQKELYDRLEEATRSKLIFYTNVSHDLRTPLTLIAGPIEKVSASPGLDKSDRELLTLARRNVSILRRLINQILDFRKLDNGKMSLNLSEADFMALASEWAASFRSLANERDINFEIDLQTQSSGDAPSTLAIDVDKIERVVFNLLSNAFRFVPDNGRVIFRARIDDRELVFTIEDSGPGIKPDELAKIFERFYQAENYTANGSGIGLALSKSLVELHNGTITAASSPGELTRFTVAIPVRHVENAYSADNLKRDMAGELVRLREPVRVGQPDLPLEDDDPKPLLLIADDNEDLRLLIRDMLSDTFRVIEAADGPQTIAIATRYVPDIVVCDIIMPGMQGTEVCRILKEEVSTSHIPVLMLTACIHDEQRIASYRNGADGFLEKPFDRDMLLARCINLLENRKRISPENALRLQDAGPDTHRRGNEPADDTVLALESEFYSEFLRIVRPMLSNADLNTEAIASKIGLGPAQLTRKIKALTNYTPIEIVRKMRLQHAHTMLMSTERSISEISYACGFSSPAYLSKCFKDVYGMSPRDFRASLGRNEK